MRDDLKDLVAEALRFSSMKKDRARLAELKSIILASLKVEMHLLKYTQMYKRQDLIKEKKNSHTLLMKDIS